MITVIALYKTKPETAEAVAEVLSRHVAATREEPGCVHFVALRSCDEPDRFVLYEQYADEDAFAAHRASTHFRVNVEETIVPMLEERRFARYDEVVPTAG